MASTVYSWTFYEKHDLEGDGAAFGPLEGYVAVVKGVDAYLGGLGLSNIQLIGSAGQVVFNAGLISVDSPTGTYRGGYVLFPGETAFVTSTATLDVTVWGYMLLGPPPS